MNFHRIALTFFLFSSFFIASASAETIKIVAFGDSLTAGYRLKRQEGFAPQLQAALEQRGHRVQVINAGVSGDTTSGGRSRLNWSVGPDADAVILELGGNDMLRGVDPKLARRNLDAMLTELTGRGLPVLLAGMRAAPNLGRTYQAAFDSIYPDLAQKHNILLYPFFLEGVAGSPRLNQRDRIHPTAEGVSVIVQNILPKVEELIIRTRKGS